MRVRLLVGLSGPAYNLAPGEEFDFPQAEAARLVDAGYAVPAAERKIERAVVAPVLEKRGKRGKNVADTDNSGGN